MARSTDDRKAESVEPPVDAAVPADAVAPEQAAVDHAPFRRGWMTGDAAVTKRDDRPAPVGTTTFRAGVPASPVVQAPEGATVRTQRVDVDGDGVDDVLSVRVEAPAQRSWLRAFGAWTGRSIVALLLVASLVAAAAAATSLWHTRQDVDRLQGDLDRATAATDVAQSASEAARARTAKVRSERNTAIAKAATLQRENDELKLEAGLLRKMLVDDAAGTTAAPRAVAARAAGPTGAATATTASPTTDGADAGLTPAPVVGDAASAAPDTTATPGK